MANALAVAGPNSKYQQPGAKPAGFWAGLWHGLISPITFLIQEREILGVGVETVGTDAGQAGTFDPPFPTHTLMHGAGKFGLASLRNLDQLPAIGAVLIAAPLKIVNGSGSPLRVLALVEG